MNKKFAFTLTEMLITLSIIGVVSAMTVPTLMNKYQKEAQAVQIRKASLEFANAVDLYLTEKGKTTLAGTDIADNLSDFIESYFKITKTCGEDDTSCFASSYRSIDNTKTSSVNCSGDYYTLANSASICVNAYKPLNISSGSIIVNKTNASRPYLKIVMDTNGAEKPNIGGRDIFTFYITKTGELTGTEPYNMELISQSPCLCLEGKDCDCEDPKCENSPLGDYCFDLLANNNWVMNY